MSEVVKSLWASIQGDPVFMRRVNGWLTIFWIVMIPVSIATGWINSVTYVAALSLWALVSGHWSRLASGTGRSEAGARSERAKGAGRPHRGRGEGDTPLMLSSCKARISKSEWSVGQVRWGESGRIVPAGRGVGL